MLNFDSDDNKLSKAELNSSRDNSVQSKVIKDRQIKESYIELSGWFEANF